MRILVTGATGYVGGRLVPLLHDAGHETVLLTRDPRVLVGRFGSATLVKGDLLRPETLPPAMQGVEVAYYLAHSMGGGEAGFRERDRRAAANFARAAQEAGVRRIVYLGGLGEDDEQLSPHLASRHEVGRELAAHGVPVIEFRAAIVIGSGSASFEILRHLTERLPVMITPRWVRTRCQPIAIRDVLAYLVGALEHPEVSGIVEIGGRDVLTYGEMMLGYARQRGLRRWMIPVPVLSPRLSSYWVSLVSPVPSGIARPLIEGLRNEVVVRDPGPAERFGIQAMGYAEAVHRAIERTTGHDIETTWFDAHAARSRRGDPPESLGSREGMIVERRSAETPLEPAQLFAAIEAVGGESGWPYHPLWELRGLLDRMVGGVGMRLGRRDPARLRVGDALDFWRVEEVRRPELLRLRAEMKVPGRAWLQFEILPVAGRPGRSTLVQTAFFEPRGVFGLAYWYALYPAHALIFRGMVRALARRATTTEATGA